MSIYRTTVDVSAVSAYPAASAPSVTIPFTPKTITVVNNAPTIGVLLSFDGVEDHAELLPGLPGAGRVFTQRVTKLWFKRSAANATTVEIVAES